MKGSFWSWSKVKNIYLCKTICLVMHTKEYDIFISYRRKSGKHIARILKEAFSRKGYSVFIDLDELKDGHFIDAILSAIDKSRVFIIIMSNDYFDKCANDGDHVRTEILYAIEKQKPLIPIIPNKVFEDYPDNTPEEIKSAISSQQYSYLDMDQLFEESMNKLICERIAPVVKLKQQKMLRIGRWMLRVLIITIALFAALLFYVKYETKDPIEYIDRANEISLTDEASPTEPVDKHAAMLYRKGAKGCELRAKEELDLFTQMNDTTNLDDARFYYHNAGYAWECLQEYDDAIQNYSMAISCAEKLCSILPSQQQKSLLIYTMNNLSYAYAEKGDYELALETIDKAIQLDTNSINTFDSKGEILYMAGRMEDSRQVWEIIHTRDPFFVKNAWVDKAFNGQ